MSDYTLTDQELNELKEVFFTEADEILDDLNQEILRLEAGQEGAEALKNIQRHLHTLKGNSRALGFSQINTLSHKAEDLLKTIHDSGAEINHAMVDLLLSIHDAMKGGIDAYRSAREPSPVAELLAKMDGIMGSCEGNGHEEMADAAAAPAALYDITIALDPRCDMKPAGVSLLGARLASLGDVVGENPTEHPDRSAAAGSFTVRLSSAESLESIRTLLDIHGIVAAVEIRQPEQRSAAPEEAAKSACAPVKDTGVQMLKVDALRVDKILNLMGELVIGRSIIGQVLTEFGERNKKDPLVKKLEGANAFMEKTLSQLQKNVMKIRMLPISQVFRKFPRVVRDLSAENNKSIELMMEGEKTEMDKSILDVIGEPLIHLVRNAIDHGIERPDERTAAGKSASGRITLRASHEGNQIVIDVIDDGRGIEASRIRRRAVERGVKTQDEVDRMTDEQAMDLIFLSGFSTADVVTDISGRGLGMDIVRMTVESLKGRIQVRSRPGEGTTFTLRLPLTLAIIRAMLFTVGDRLLALPMSSIERIVRLRPNDIQTVSGKKVLRYRERVISLVSIRETLSIVSADDDPGRHRFVIVVSLLNKLYGFLVDRITGQQELVIKALDNHWGTLNCASGASILGNGKVVLILDAPAVVAKEIGREAMHAA